MIVFKNNIIRLLKNRLNLFLTVVFPVIFIALMMNLNSGYKGGDVVVALVDKDESKLTEILKNNMKLHGKVVISTEEELKDKLLNNQVDYAVVIEKDFAKKLIEGKEPEIKGYALNETNLSLPPKFYLESFLSSAKNIANSSKGNEENFYKAMELYEKGSFKSEYANVNDKEGNKVLSMQSLGFLIMGVFSLATFSSNLMIKDKEKNVYSRLFTTPLTIKSYMIQNILSFLTLSLLQVFALLIIVSKVFKGDLGPSILNMFLMIAPFSLVCVSLNLAIGSFSKDSRQASAIGGLIFTPFCMLGGCFWPREIMPEILLKISNFVPTTWVLKGAEKILYGKGLGEVTTEVGILVLFSAVFFLLSSWKKTDIAK